MRRLLSPFALLLATVFCLLASVVSAQIDGSVSVMLDRVDEATELRARVTAEHRRNAGEHLRLVLSGYVDALLADRGSTKRAATVRPQELYAEAHGERGDLRIGISRVVWGRLDEFQPTDVVNPIDLSRFILEGRGEARLPVAMVRGRAFLSASTTLEGIVVPSFREGRFDQLDESTSPFNFLPFEFPDSSGTQGGARLTSTIGRVDVGVSAYRGIRSFPPHERFTMVGGDFETVRGQWGVRGEGAWFDEGTVRAFEGGIGADRRAGGYRVAANLLYTHRLDDDVTLVVVADRSFARETRTARVFAVYNPSDGTTFTRAILSLSLRDNVAIEGSGGLFTGAGDDTLGRLTTRDFVYARLKVFF